jgi:spermidine synthase
MSSLVYQVVWQRYLSILVGSEASSATMVISLFLLGMSIGYYLFGELSKRVSQREKLLKLYGYTELATGAYAICFPIIFQSIFNSSLLISNNFFLNLLITAVLILPPTIMMGATVPVMTSILPDRNSFVNRGHAIIYGVNTIGAFTGVMLGGLFLVNKFGLELTITLIGAINILVSLPYIFNKLQGNIIKNDELENVEQELNNKELYIFSFLSGLGILGLEIIWLRILGLTIGASLVVFPLVLGVFILGIGMASLSLKKMGAQDLRKNLLVGLIALFVNYVLAPFLPRMAMMLRVTLSDMGFVFYLYYILCFIFLCAFLLPVIIPLGRILPLTYAYLRKTKEEFGLQCGLLYSFNTLGTLVGSIFLGYLVLNFVSIQTVFKIIVIVIGFGSIYVAIKQNHRTTVGVAISLSLVCLLTEWKRDDQLRGLFRYSISRTIKDTKSTDSVKKIELSDKNIKQYYFEDGAGSTVAVIGHSTAQGETKSIMVNGKSDSSTIGDYSTISLLSILPLLYTDKIIDLKTAVVGLGTGVTAGLLGELNFTSVVDVSEISPEVIKAQEFFKKENYNLLSNKKININAIDAFNFFKRKSNYYDIIVSEPTNPWTVGVENLFTNQFYKRVKKSLTTDGVFVQWLQGYSTNKEIFAGVIGKIKREFGNAILYKTHDLDYAVVASASPLIVKNIKSLDQNKAIRNVLKHLKMKSLNEIHLHEKLDDIDVSVLAKVNPELDHDLFNPKLSILSLKSFFFGEELNVEGLISPYLSRLNRGDIKSINIDSDRLKKILQDKCLPEAEVYMNLHCTNKVFISAYYRFTNGHGDLWQQMQDYSILRKYNHIERDTELIEKFLSQNLRNQNRVRFAFNELLKEGEFIRATKFLEESSNILSENFLRGLNSNLQRIKLLQKQFNRVGSR